MPLNYHQVEPLHRHRLQGQARTPRLPQESPQVDWDIQYLFKLTVLSLMLYRVTIHLGTNLPLTSKHKFRFSMRLMYFVLVSTGGLDQRDVSPCRGCWVRDKEGRKKGWPLLISREGRAEDKKTAEKELHEWVRTRTLHKLFRSHLGHPLRFPSSHPMCTVLNKDGRFMKPSSGRITGLLAHNYWKNLAGNSYFWRF